MAIDQNNGNMFITGASIPLGTIAYNSVNNGQ